MAAQPTHSERVLAGGGQPCRSSCPVHMSCRGFIHRISAGREHFGELSGLVPVAQCSTCEALFGLDHGVLRFLEHPQEYKQRQSPPGVL
jgi:hypothetical protein